MKDWLKNHKKDLIYFATIIILIFFLSFSVRTCQNNSNRYENNLYALTDTISYYQSANGALVASKTAFESDIKELKLVNEKLYNELNDLKIKMKNIQTGVHFEAEADFGQNDTIFVVQRDTIDNIPVLNHRFDFSNQWRILNGQVALKNDSLKLSIDNDKVLFDYTVAVDKNNKVYIKSNNPYITYNEISGYVIPKPKTYNFSVGPSIGVGYGVINKKPDLFLGITATWNVIKF